MKAGISKTVIAEKMKTEAMFETPIVGKRFRNRTSNKDDKKKQVTTEDTKDALAWLSLVDDGKKEDENAQKTKPSTRYKNRTSHRDKKGWDRFFCSL